MSVEEVTVRNIVLSGAKLQRKDFQKLETQARTGHGSQYQDPGKMAYNLAIDYYARAIKVCDVIIKVLEAMPTDSMETPQEAVKALRKVQEELEK